MAARRVTKSAISTSAEMLMPRVAHLESEMGEVKKTLVGINSTLQEIARVQTEMRASAPADWSVMLGNVNQIAWLAALLIGGIIWISSMVNTSPSKDLEARIAIMEMQLKLAEKK